MTPEERAAQLWFELNILLPPLPKSWSAAAVNEACTAMIISTINRAVAAERELCAHICDVMAQDVAGQWYGNEDFRRGASKCAHLIRNQLTVASSTQEISPKSPDRGA